MRIREYTAGDFDAMRRLHAAQGFAYPLPDLESPLFVTRLVLEADGTESCHSERSEESAFDRSNGENAGCEPNREIPRCARNDKSGQGTASPRIVMAAFLRLTAEAYLLHDPQAGTPRERWQHLLALHEAARNHAAARGLDDVQAFVPPQIARAFGRRLARLGWRHDPWPCFSRATGNR